MAKTDFLTADMTRRQFMKISGKSLAGLTLSASMLSLFGCSQQQVDSGAVATWALPQGLLVVNADLCTGCQRCEINCTLTNDGVCSSYISRVKIQRRLNLDGAGNGLLSGNDNCWVYFPDTCRQCEDPACGNACPQKAITTNAQGIRVEVDARSEKIGKKIREATLGKIPYMLVVGDRDIENETVSVRTRGGEDLGAMSRADFAARVLDDVKTKRIW